jgi:type I restriction enzyme S subunit
MSELWSAASFDDCVAKVTYTTKIPRKDFLEHGPWPVVSQEEGLINGYWNNEADLFRVTTPLVVFGDHTRIFKFVDFDFVLGADGVKVLQPREFLLPKFFFYQLLAADLKSLGYSRHYRLLRDLEIRYPSRTEQHRIVSVLDEAFAAIAAARANTEQNLRNARELFERRLDAAFCGPDDGRVERRLGDVCWISSKLVDPRRADYVDLTHVGAGNIESDTGKLLQLKTAQEEALISGKFFFDETMVLYSKIRPYLRKVARPDFKGLCSADIYPLSPQPGQITRDYLYYLLLSRRFTEYAMQGSARAGMPKVNRDHLFEYRVWLPAVEQQAKDAAVLDLLADDTARLATVFQQKLAAVNELKQSLLREAFAGAL